MSKSIRPKVTKTERSAILADAKAGLSADELCAKWDRQMATVLTILRGRPVKGVRTNTHATADDWFWSKVRRNLGEDACWEWTGARDLHGYGITSMQGVQPRSAKAHRIAWVLAGGTLDGQKILHACDNPACVRSSHLFAGSSKDNSQDMRRKKRDNGGWCPGHLSGRAKLTWERVELLRSLPREKVNFSEMARTWGVTAAAVRFAYIGATWKHKVMV